MEVMSNGLFKGVIQIQIDLQTDILYFLSSEISGVFLAFLTIFIFDLPVFLRSKITKSLRRPGKCQIHLFQTIFPVADYNSIHFLHKINYSIIYIHVHCTSIFYYFKMLLNCYLNPIILEFTLVHFILVYFEGWRRFSEDIEIMLGFKPNIYWIATWTVIAPIFIVVSMKSTFIDSLSKKFTIH